jgi:hypothetical protein
VKVAILTLALALVVPAAALSSPSSSSSWRVVASKSASDPIFAATLTRANIAHPKGIAVRFSGTDIHGDVRGTCIKRSGLSPWEYKYGRGLHVIGHVAGATSCLVLAFVQGRGRVTVQILKWR